MGGGNFFAACGDLRPLGAVGDGEVARWGKDPAGDLRSRAQAVAWRIRAVRQRRPVYRAGEPAAEPGASAAAQHERRRVQHVVQVTDPSALSAGRPGTCSANVTLAHAWLAHTNRRARKTMSTSWRPLGYGTTGADNDCAPSATPCDIPGTLPRPAQVAASTCTDLPTATTSSMIKPASLGR